RAFLGSSNPKPEAVVPYVDLAVDDDMRLSELRFGAPRETLERLLCRSENPLYVRPYPIWSAAVNVTNASVLGLQERKASSFIFSPMYCGFEQYMADRQTGYRGPRTITPYAASSAYQRSEECGTYRPIERGQYKIETMTVGLAMAVSGAAFTSNSG